jgi:hypothetical protein
LLGAPIPCETREPEGVGRQHEMRTILAKARLADFQFIVGQLDSNLNFADDLRLNRALRAYRQNRAEKQKRALIELIEREYRYAGSADLAYLLRRASGREPGPSVDEIVSDVARKLDVKVRLIGPLPDRLERLTTAVVEKGILSMTSAEQLGLFVAHGSGLEHAKELRKRMKRHGPVAALPILLTLLGPQVSEKIVTSLVIRQIGWIIGRDAARLLLDRLATRFPWWAEWIGPIAWAVSGALLTIDIQGPAYRKTIPVTLYLGLISLRERLARHA